MKQDRTTLLLERHQLRKTNFRVELLNLFVDNSLKALSNIDIESELSDYDRVTLYRTLKTFEQKGLIHLALDGSESTKYALCSHGSCYDNHHEDNHAHFHCNNCGITVCIDELQAPNIINIPNGFSVSSTHLIVKGKCNKCN
ncbi:MAG: transcriptional repressor [Saprospiraceae bacterium]|nr:transcriptional repressor [Saprospiraceae bacterium]